MKQIEKELAHNAKYFNNWRRKLRGSCIRYIVAAIQKYGTIEFDYDNDEYVSVVYDGGNHPEYASNAFSQVNKVYMKKNDIYVETEDSDIKETELSTEELYDIATTIHDFCIPRMENADPEDEDVPLTAEPIY